MSVINFCKGESEFGGTEHSLRDSENRKGPWLSPSNLLHWVGLALRANLPAARGKGEKGSSWLGVVRRASPACLGVGAALRAALEVSG